MGADKSGDLILAEEDYAQEVRQDDCKVDSLLDEDDGESEPISIFSTADKRRLFIVEDIIKACAGCRPSFLFTGYVVERSPGALPSSLRLSSREKTIEKDLTLSLRYEPPSPKFSRSCPTSTSYRLKVSRGAEFLYLTRGLTKKIRVDKVQLVVLWGNLELAFANSEELGIFTSALKYVDVEEGSEKEVPPAAKTEKEGAEGRGLFGGKGSLYDWVVPVSVSLALLAVVSYHVVKKRQ
ncbi:hypothetical protein HKI87_01g04160 [Chloropicon roscoffensis]|uniref:Uncharacterized protein n=1 Tax=Chloropicon roscoffensis TaxID=1461544 RepID=A0AAX4NZB1_9CHLO|mmetsp:Transcript_11838/g.35995  ORF Transcript_11838/g.35995 Transcript_11838/m.35995 type:complete len:238 (-) Transcript_11838:1633-2346(-)